MNVAILHYHLQRGGVTQVIRHHLQAFAEWPDTARPRLMLVSSGRDAGWTRPPADASAELEIHRIVLPQLDYEAAEVQQADTLAEQLCKHFASAGWEAAHTLIHIHNHQLGKNLAVTAMAGCLARRGYALLLQVHDFAEDFRPDRYARLQAAAATSAIPFAELVYPQAPHIHYAVLNTRDAVVLRGAGIDPSRIHLLPNPVMPFALEHERERVRRDLEREFAIPRDTRFIIYPVRGIRRKNLGELLLWSVLTGDAAAYAVTLPPINPLEVPSYTHWKRLGEDLHLPCRLDWQSSRHWPLSASLVAADHVITTSVAEGFGMVFLEAWLAHRQLLGRDLPEITELFRNTGLDLCTLAPEFLVPWDWIDRNEYERHARELYERAIAAYGRTLDVDMFARIAKQRAAEPGIDFALLPTSFQHEAIVRAYGSARARRELSVLNPQTALALEPADEQLLERNAAVIRAHFSIPRCAEQLRVIYERVAASPRGAVSGVPHSSAVLDAFLSFGRFHPLRVEV